MDLSLFKKSIEGNEPPQEASVYLKALWYDAKGEWDRSHKLIQDIDDHKAAWIHAYLHRREGDIGNADYWYERAGKKRPECTLENEWEELATALIE